MSLLFGPSRAEARADRPTNNLWEMLRRRMPYGMAGVPTDNESALRLSAVYACHDKLTSIVGAFPAGVYRRQGGVRIPIDEQRPMIDAPSEDLDALDWRALVMSSWLMRGGAAGLVTVERRTHPTKVELVHPGRVRVERRRRDDPVQWLLDDKPIERWPDGPLWYEPGRVLSPGDPTGRSVIEYARQTVGLGLATQKFGADFFASGAHPTAALTNTKEVNADGAKRVKERLLRAVGPDREPIVLGGGWDLKHLQIAPNESQFLDTIKANATDIARFFGVPAAIIDAPSGSGMTYQNVEHKGMDLLRFTVNFWVIKLERALSKLLPRPEFVKLNVDSLLRTDLATRYRAYDMAVRMGKNNIDEIRALEDEAPLPDGAGQNYLWPPYRAQLTEPELQQGADAGGASA